MNPSGSEAATLAKSFGYSSSSSTKRPRMGTRATAPSASVGPSADDFEDDIDESVLLMASQMADEVNLRAACAEQPKNNAVNSEDIAEMTRMLENDEDWMDDDDWAKEAGGRKVPQFAKPLDPPTSSRRNATAAVTSSDSGTVLELERKLQDKDDQVKKLKDETFSKHGEVINLRAELKKRDLLLERERAERARAVDLKNTEIRHLEEAKKSAVDKVTTENTFLQRDLESLQAQVKKLKTKEQSGTTKKRNQNGVTPPLLIGTTSHTNVAKRAANMPEGFDEDLLFDGPKKKPPPPPPQVQQQKSPKTTDSSAQTDDVPRDAEPTLAMEILALVPSVSMDYLAKWHKNSQESYLSALLSAGPEELKASHTIDAVEKLIERVHQELRSEHFLRAKGRHDKADAMENHVGWDLLAAKLIADAFPAEEEPPVCLNSSTLNLMHEMMPLLKADQVAPFYDVVHFVMKRRLLDKGSFVAFINEGLDGLVKRTLRDEHAPELAHLIATTAKIRPHLCYSLCYIKREGACILKWISNTLSRMLSKASRAQSRSDEADLSRVQGGDALPSTLRWSNAFSALFSAALAYPRDSGDLEQTGPYCDVCKVFLTSTLVMFCAVNVKLEMDCRSKGVEPHPATYSALYANIACLRQLWNSCPTEDDYLDLIGELPKVQRHYIWMMDLLPDLLPDINRGQSEDMVLDDIRVEIDYSQKTDVTEGDVSCNGSIC